MQFRTILALFGGLSCLTRFDAVKAEAVQAPFRLRVNTDLMKSLVNLRDQEFFHAFEDIETEVTAPLGSLTFSLAPKNGHMDDFDFDIQLSKEDFGASSDNIKATGSATLAEGGEFTFTVPVKSAKLQYALEKQNIQKMKGLPLDFEQFVWNEKTFDFTVDADALEVTGATVSDEAKAAVVAAVQGYIQDYRDQIAKQTKFDAQIKNQEKLPMDSILPVALLYYGTQLAESIEFEQPFVSIGASLENFNLLNAKQRKLLKPLKGKLTKEQSDKGHMAMAQVAIDDNLFNSFSSLLTSIENTYSARKMMKANPKAQPFLQMMTTSTIGKVMPQIAEDYGHGKQIDLMFSPSHSLFVDGLPGSKMSGVYIDKNGNLKFAANIVINLTAETTPGRHEDVRNMYMTLVFKMKIKQDDSNPFNKRFSMTPRSLEISQLKVMKGDEEMTSEQMMLRSMANLQLEALKKNFKELPISLGDIVKKNPKQLSCLGFNFSDLDISFQKGQAQFTAYYKNVNKPDKEFCDNFIQEMQNVPKKIEDQVKEATNSPLMKDLQNQAQANFDAKNAEMKETETVKEDL